MNRNQYNLHISNISDRTDQDDIISFFSQFGKIESYTFFQKTSERSSSSIIITYGLSVDINKIIQNNQRIKFHDKYLYLRRTLPLIRPAYEHFMSSNQLLISFDCLSNDNQFNEKTIRTYFNKYGSIVSCRIIIMSTTYLINFAETHSVDWAILEEPHFYNNKELILRKYVSPDSIKLFHTKNIFSENRKIKYSFFERFRRLTDIIEAMKFAQKIDLKLIQYFYKEKTLKYNEEINKLTLQLKQNYFNIDKDIQIIKEKNNSLKVTIEQNQGIRKNMMNIYKTKIQYEQNRMNELKQAIDFLNCY